MNVSLAEGLPNDYQAQDRSLGWVLFDGADAYLCDVEEAGWVCDDDDEEMPPLYFENLEEVYRAFFRSEKAAELRLRRREAAFRELGRDE